MLYIVILYIVGTTGRTAYQRLEPRYKTDFERAGKATFLILDRPVGYLRYMKFFKEKHATPSDWYLDYVILSTPYNNKSYTLPVYRWFTDEVSLLTVRDGPGNKALKLHEILYRDRNYLLLKRNTSESEIKFCNVSGNLFLLSSIAIINNVINHLMLLFCIVFCIVYATFCDVRYLYATFCDVAMVRYVILCLVVLVVRYVLLYFVMLVGLRYVT